MPAGTYEVEASAPYYEGGAAQLYVYDTTGTSTIATGTNVFCGGGGTGDGVTAHLSRQKIVLGVQSDIVLRHFITAGATNGLGRSNTSGLTSVYADMFIEKVA